MRRVIAFHTVVVTVLTLIYAPLLHVHVNTGEAPVFHVHLPDIEDAAGANGVHMESRHSHSQSRSVDLLTTTASHGFAFSAVILSAFADLDKGRASCGFMAAVAPCSHAPPDVPVRIPRAPPA